MAPVPAPLVPQNTQELLSTLLHQTMLVFNALKDFRITEPDETRHKMRVERIAASSNHVVQTFKTLRENCTALYRNTKQFSVEEREKRSREIVMGSGDKKRCAELEEEKRELEEELEFYNRQLKEVIDETRGLISDVNSIQFYS